MATRRVKRIKRTKKQVQHGRRKTNRRRQRHTRRQRGGMLKSFAKFVGSENLNKRNGPLYDGIEVFKATVGGDVRYYIGNQSLDNYAESSNPQDVAYGKKIASKLQGLMGTVDTGKIFKGTIYLDQDNFDKFVKKFSDSASGAAGASAAVVPRVAVASAAPVAVASDDSAAEFDNTCVINSDQVSFLGTQFKWTNHEIPLEITDFRFAQKNKNLMDWLNENVDKFVFFKAERIVRVMTKKSAVEDTYDAIFLSIHFKKTKENYCALAKFKDKDAFNQLSRIYDKTLRYPHFLLYPNNQPGTNNTTDQANVATCYIGKYEALPTRITYNDFAVVIDKFVEYKKAGCDEALAREFYKDDPVVLALFEYRGSLSAQMSELSISP